MHVRYPVGPNKEMRMSRFILSLVVLLWSAGIASAGNVTYVLETPGVK